jgi:hypothetical protein
MDVEPGAVVSIAYRRMRLLWARAVGAVGMVMAAGVIFLGPHWIVALILFGVTVGASALIFNSASRPVLRLTGLSPEEQTRVWDRYRNDPVFAARLKIALAGGGLSKAIDEAAQRHHRRWANRNGLSEQ